MSPSLSSALLPVLSTVLALPTLTAAVQGFLSYNSLAATPQMGWDTYNAYSLDYNETTITDNANLLVRLGFRDLGYKVIIFDDAMTELNRSANGTLVENASKFPSGLKTIADQLHADGLQFGVYSSAGRFTCGGYPGALGYESQDAEWWASLGADYLKYDNCFNEGQSGTPQISEQRYAVMSKALNSTGRPFLYSLCNWGDDKSWEWASTIANSARMSGDIADLFDRPTAGCPCGPDEYYCQLPGYGCSVYNILGKASYITSKNQPGYWNDLDMLEVGNGNMDYDEYKLHFSMWAAIKSPLIMGNKLTALSPRDYGILINPAVIALNQDPQGVAIQRSLVEKPSDISTDRWNVGELQVWRGSLSGGDQVVAFLNFGNTSREMSYSLIDIFGGIRSDPSVQKSWALYDLWGNQTVIPDASAAAVLNGTADIATVDGGRWYYNASSASNAIGSNGSQWAAGLARNESLLLGTPVGTVEKEGTISTQVPRHGIAIWRLREVESASMRKRDEL